MRNVCMILVLFQALFASASLGAEAPTCTNVFCQDPNGGSTCQAYVLKECTIKATTFGFPTTLKGYIQDVNLLQGGSISLRQEWAGTDVKPTSQFCPAQYGAASVSKEQTYFQPLYWKVDIADAFVKFQTDASFYGKYPMCMTNGQFFVSDNLTYTPMALPVKYNGSVISYGYDVDFENAADQVRGLLIYGNGAAVSANPDPASVSQSPIMRNNLCLGLAQAPTVIVGFNPYTVSKESVAFQRKGRTFVGTIGLNANTGRYDRVVILSSNTLAQQEAIDFMTSYGVHPNNVVMLDGSGSSRLRCLRPGSQLPYELFRPFPADYRKLPQFIATSVIRRTVTPNY